MSKLSDEQRRVLLYLRRRGAGTPDTCRCRVSTFYSLARRKLIYVDTTLASIAYPRTAARAQVTDAGRAALSR
jgi:hypothetical protein